MDNPTLRLTSRQQSFHTLKSYYSVVDSDELWSRVQDETLLLFVKAPLLFELARRNDSNLLDYCEKLLNGTVEEWFLALRVMGRLGTKHVFTRLEDLYLETPPHKRSHIVGYAAQAMVLKKHRPVFKKMLLSIVCKGHLDVTGWTDLALETLDSVCKRMDIEIVDERSDSVTATVEEEIDDITNEIDWAPLR